MKYKRKKAMWGALAGMAVSLAGNVISGIINKNAQEKQQAKENALANQQNNLTAAANLANAINGSTDIVDDYNDRISFKKGGKYKRANWGTLLSSLGGAAGNVVNAAMNANTMGNIQTVRQAPAQFQPKELVRPTYYNRIQPAQYVFKNGGRKPDGGIVQYEDDPMVLRDIRRAQDVRRNKQFDRDLLKTIGILAASGLGAYGLSGFAAAEAAATTLPTGEAAVEYLPLAGEYVPAAAIEALFAPMQYKSLKEHGPEIIDTFKQMGRDIKNKFSPKNNIDNQNYGPYNLSEVVVEAPRKRKGNKYKRK